MIGDRAASVTALARSRSRTYADVPIWRGADAALVVVRA